MEIVFPILLLFLIIVPFIAICYFGYYQDFKRDKKRFSRTIFAMPLGFILGILGLDEWNEKLKKWANDEVVK